MRGGTGRAVELTTTSVTYRKELAAHTGLEPVISALRGQRVNQLHQCAAIGLWDYRGPVDRRASLPSPERGIRTRATATRIARRAQTPRVNETFVTTNLPLDDILRLRNSNFHEYSKRRLSHVDEHRGT